jgi:hypothetical protein
MPLKVSFIERFPMAVKLIKVQTFLRAKCKSSWRYGRSHPNFKWHLSIVALISVISVTGAMALATEGSNNTRSLLVETSGAQALTAKQLTALVVKEKLLAYWLGPVSGSKYTLIATSSGKVTVSYLSGGLGISDASQRNLVIETTGDGVTPGALLSSESEFNNATDLTVTGNTFSYDKSLVDHMTVQIKADGRHVFVGYPQTRTPLTMQTDAEALAKIG